MTEFCITRQTEFFEGMKQSITLADKTDHLIHALEFIKNFFKLNPQYSFT